MENPETRPSESPPPAPPPPARDSPHRESPHAAPSPMQKSPILAAFLSVLPGLGNIYNGLYQRGVVFFLVYVSLFALAINSAEREKAFIIPCVVFVFFFNIFDAYRQATLINYFGHPPPAGEGRPDMRGWGLAPGVFLVALGAYGVLRRYFNIDLSWVIDQWPIALMAIGAWFIYGYFRGKKGEGEGVLGEEV